MLIFIFVLCRLPRMCHSHNHSRCSVDLGFTHLARPRN